MPLAVSEFIMSYRSLGLVSMNEVQFIVYTPKKMQSSKHEHIAENGKMKFLLHEIFSSPENFPRWTPLPGSWGEKVRTPNRITHLHRPNSALGKVF